MVLVAGLHTNTMEVVNDPHLQQQPVPSLRDLSTFSVRDVINFCTVSDVAFWNYMSQNRASSSFIEYINLFLPRALKNEVLSPLRNDKRLHVQFLMLLLKEKSELSFNICDLNANSCRTIVQYGSYVETLKLEFLGFAVDGHFSVDLLKSLLVSMHKVTTLYVVSSDRAFVNFILSFIDGLFPKLSIVFIEDLYLNDKCSPNSNQVLEFIGNDSTKLDSNSDFVTLLKRPLKHLTISRLYCDLLKSVIDANVQSSIEYLEINNCCQEATCCSVVSTFVGKSFPCLLSLRLSNFCAVDNSFKHFENLINLMELNIKFSEESTIYVLNELTCSFLRYCGHNIKSLSLRNIETIDTNYLKLQCPRMENMIIDCLQISNDGRISMINDRNCYGYRALTSLHVRTKNSDSNLVNLIQSCHVLKYLYLHCTIRGITDCELQQISNCNPLTSLIEFEMLYGNLSWEGMLNLVKCAKSLKLINLWRPSWTYNEIKLLTTNAAVFNPCLEFKITTDGGVLGLLFDD